MRLTVAGKRRDFGLGPLHKVSLSEARERAGEYRAKAYRGIDPVGERHEAQHAEPARHLMTFEQAVKHVHSQRRSAWSNGKHVEQWINTLHDYAFPFIGKMPVDRVTTADVLKVLSPIWNSKPETARRVRQRVDVVLDWARAAGYRSGDNPVELIGDALPRHKKANRHHAALPYTEVSKFITRLRTGQAHPITKLAFEFLILTAARTTEVRKARWQEISFPARTWTIPGNDAASGRRMKAGRDHVVPLSLRCVELLELANSISGGNDLIFPDSRTGRVTSENRFLVARDALGYAKDVCTPHGFRSSFRDWAAEETTFPAEVVEMALAHAITNKVEGAYRRGNLLTKRAGLMDAWAVYACADRNCG